MASVAQSSAQLASCSTRRAFTAAQASRRGVKVVCQAQLQGASPDRRQVLSALIATAGLVATQGAAPALADTEFATFFGQDKPPTSYGGYGGTMIETAKYIFEYPANWKSDVINKIEKGTQGIDCRVYNPRNKQQQAWVITLARAGEDNASFRLTDVDSTIAGFAGADYDLQDALGDATKTSSSREVEGQLYYDINIDSPSIKYLTSITVKEGKVYALFVKVPSSIFEAQKADMQHIVDTFRTN